MTTNIADTIKAYFSRYNAGDIEGIVSLFAENAVLEDPAGTQPKAGKPEIREFVTGAVGYGSRLEGPICLLISGNEAAFHFQARFNAAASQTALQIIDTIRVDEQGLIVGLRAFYNPSDLAELFGQAG